MGAARSLTSNSRSRLAWRQGPLLSISLTPHNSSESHIIKDPDIITSLAHRETIDLGLHCLVQQVPSDRRIIPVPPLQISKGQQLHAQFVVHFDCQHSVVILT